MLSNANSLDSLERWVVTPLARDEAVLQRAAISVRQRKILAFLQEPRRLDEVAQSFTISLHEATAAMSRLAELGLVSQQQDEQQAALSQFRSASEQTSSSNRKRLFGIVALLVAFALGGYAFMQGLLSPKERQQAKASSEMSPQGKKVAPDPDASLAPLLKAAQEAGSAAAREAAAKADRLAVLEARTAAEAKALAEARAQKATNRERDSATPVLVAPATTGQPVGTATPAAPSPAAQAASAPPASPTPVPTPAPSQAPAAAPPQASPAPAAASPQASPAPSAPSPSSAQVASASPSISPTPAPVTAGSPSPAREPRLVTRVEPIFPRNTQESSGTVRARLSVNPAGVVTQVEILASNPPRVFDRSVINALSQWRYEPTGSSFQTLAEVNFSR